jgi:hypothetical protein
MIMGEQKINNNELKGQGLYASLYFIILSTYFIVLGMYYCMFIVLGTSRDSAVGIATSYGLDDRGVGVRVPVGSRIFTSPNRPDRL